MSNVSKAERRLLEQLGVRPGDSVRMKEFDPAWVPPIARGLQKDDLKARSREYLRRTVEELAASQGLPYASDVYSVLVVLQAMDAAGKDGTIKHVMSGINPQGCQVYSFKQPSAEELDHNFLWRYAKALPERGRIGIFNRSYYLLEKQRLPPGRRGKSFWGERFDDINAFEKHLVENGTLIVKFLLNVSRKEQKRRFLDRLDRPEKNWKFSVADVRERRFWDDYMEAFGDMLSATSTEYAPWYVIPADHKYVARALVASVLSTSIQTLGLTPPKVDSVKKQELAAARKELMAEKS